MKLCKRSLYALLALICFLPVACGDDSGTTSDDLGTSADQVDASEEIVEGLQIGQDGSVVVNGAPMEAGTVAWGDDGVLGAPSELLVLEASPRSRLRFEYTDLGIAGYTEGPSATETVVVSFEVWAAGASLLDGSLALGDSEADAQGALGEPERDPFAPVWWYPGEGLGLVWEEGTLARFIVFPPAP